MPSLRVCIVGCGSFATSIAKVIGLNVTKSSEFDKQVSVFVHVGEDNDASLIDIINEHHCNPRYLPGVNLPENVVAKGDIAQVVSDADIIALIYPTRYVSSLLDSLKGLTKKNAYFITFCKGLISVPEKNELRLISDIIRHDLGRTCVAVIGATTALEVASEQFTEATIGTTNAALGAQVKRLLQTPYFRLHVVSDEIGVELCGSLKHVVAIAAGLIDGLGLGDNTKAAILRLGFWEMFELMKELFPGRGTSWLTIEQSCGIAELFMCMAHRNTDKLPQGYDLDCVNILVGRRLSKLMPVDITSSLSHARADYVDGVLLAAAINQILVKRNRTEHYPLFTTVHDICSGALAPDQLINHLRNHPVHQ